MPAGDVTTHALFPFPLSARATIIAREPLTLAGLMIARHVFHTVDPSLHIMEMRKDGQSVQKGAVLMKATGNAHSLLQGERVALNFLQHLSGIATLTTQFSQAIEEFPAKILDTRKTTPGLRVLEKWAVSLGGGLNHRQSLSDGILIKDNHRILLQAKGIRLAQACQRARERAPHGLRISIEVESLQQLKEALKGSPDIVLLDNMSPPLVKKAVTVIQGRALIEVSGGVNLENIRELAAAGADYISIGALTHSAPAVDISMELAPSLETHSRSK